MITSAKENTQEDQILSVAIPRPLHGLFTYKLPHVLSSQIRVGGWVRVPFGRTVTHAFVVEPPKLISQAALDFSPDRLKAVLEVGNADLNLPADVLALCRWAHEYYSTPLGEALNCAAAASLFQSEKKVKGERKLRKVFSDYSSEKTHVLTQDQVRVVQFLENLRTQKAGKVALLQGVTGSGKTEVYIELARKTLEEGGGVIILVPEIALTSQLHRRFESSLGVKVGLWHSAVSGAQRKVHERALREGTLKIIVGARSAVFAPVKNLGLIVVDEEHDPTFKQEDRMRYHARDLAVVRAKLTQAFAVLGSATPSLETRERVREGRYEIAKLESRIAPGGLPQIELIDLKTEPKVEKTQAILATKTIQTIQQTLDAGEQVIIYLNRRGFAAYLLCKSCGDVKGCPQCSISLTVYRVASGLRCHLCGHRERIPDTCLKCQGSELYAMGAGTESLETELPEILTGAKILRLDRDQITSTTRLEKVLSSFRKQETNLLLGTQMLAKGHDFPGVTLVVVILADSLFRWPDFRAPERAFQILKQVAGRAGRGEKSGRVLIQTFDVDHPVLQVVLGKVGEETFLEGERELRQALSYPPFGRIARVRFESADREEAVARSTELTRELHREFSKGTGSPAVDILGPSEAFLKRVKTIYRWDLLLKAKTVENLQRAIVLSRNYCAERKWQFLVDIDPYGI